MREKKNKPSYFLNSHIHSINYLIAILSAIIFSLLIYSTTQVYAQTGTEGAPYRAYLPFTVRPGTTYYVSPDGDDNANGTVMHPWKTLGKAAEMVQAGSTLYLRGGVYNEYVSFRNNGTAANPIKIIGVPGENPVIDGQYQDPGAYTGLLVIRGDHYIISGLEIRNSALMGMFIYGDYNTIDHVFSHHNRENGILINHGIGSIVENCQVWRNVLSNEYGQADKWSTGLSAARNGVQYAIIRNNTVWENWGEGISSFEADHITIEDNISHDNFAINIYVSDTTNAIVQRNFLYTDPSSITYNYGPHIGIAMGDEVYSPISTNISIINNIAIGNQGNFWWWQGPQGGGMNQVLIANNTFINGISDPGQGRAGVMIDNGTHQDVRFENNIIQQDGALPVISVSVNPGISFSHNLWSKAPVVAASGQGDIIADPGLSHTGDPYSPEWYQLSSYSPAINSAKLLVEVILDYFGISRLPTPDIGADEFFLP